MILTGTLLAPRTLRRNIDRIADYLISKKGQLLVILILAAGHIPFVLWNEIGEQDEARLLLDATDWRILGHQLPSQYRSKTSPLYILALHALTNIRPITTYSLCTITSLLSLLASLALYPTVIYLARFARFSSLASVTTALLLQVMPNIWFMGLYGFPTILSLFLLMASLVVYVNYLQSVNSGWFRVVLLTSALLLYALCGILKLDTLLCGVAFIYFLLQHKNKVSWFHDIVLLTIFPIASYALHYWVVAQFFTPVVQAEHFWGTWEYSYPASVSYMFRREAWEFVLRAYGYWMFLFGLYCTGVLMYRRSRTRPHLRIELCILLAWLLPLTLFWGCREGNSARHMTVASPALAFIIGLYLTQSKGVRSFVLVIAVWVASVLMVPPSSQIFLPSARLLKSSWMFKRYQQNVRRSSESLLKMSSDKIMFIGGEMEPYTQAYVTAGKLSKVRMIPRSGSMGEYHITSQGGVEKTVLFFYGMPPLDSMLAYIDRGYTPVAFEEYFIDLIDGLKLKKN